MASCGTVVTACIHQFCLRLCISSGGETDLVACSVRGFIGWGKLKCQCMMDRGLNGQQNQTYPWKVKVKVKVMNLLHESPNKSHLFTYDWLELSNIPLVCVLFRINQQT
ncbi:BnaC02g25620D [Brassica napus]|uniref:BnaC02g25620D protein n=1 Tax=Brassica napus TaxID=3708 RepID=A0A078GC35_BRANA|nr:BnaC02g25620D [Brassica napus]